MTTGDFAYGGIQRSYSFPLLHADKIPNSLVAVQCPNLPNVKIEQIFLQNDPDSSGNITIGDSRLAATGNGIVLTPGSVTGWIPLNDLSKIWHKDAAASTLNYMVIGSPK